MKPAEVAENAKCKLKNAECKLKNADVDITSR